MNKLFLFIIVFLLIIFYCWNQNLEKFTWAWGYFPKPGKLSKFKGLPPGAWKNTCIVQDFRDPLLWASCENDYGKHIEASIDIDKCFDRKIRNVKGVLECD